jgi:hypothetical protein
MDHESTVPPCANLARRPGRGSPLADDAYVFDDGAVVYSGSAQELAAADARVRSLAGASAQEWTLV